MMPFPLHVSPPCVTHSRKSEYVNPLMVAEVPSLNVAVTARSPGADVSSTSGSAYSGAGLALLESRR
eukprot:8528512-Pyramimonas_sp.AAC.1